METVINEVVNKLWERKIQLSNRLCKLDNGNYANKGLINDSQGTENNLLIKSLCNVMNRIEHIEDRIVDFSTLEGNEEKIKSKFEDIEIELSILEGILIEHEKIIESLETLETLF